jgi:DNA polymerase
VWCDWSAIEARVLPWMSGSRTSEDVLDIFRTNDVDPSLPDIYKFQAGKLLGKDPKDVTKAERQSHGKVPVLSLGFAGGKGALFNMARIYGASFTDEEAESAVRGWRDANPWAKRFWGEVWDAAQYCMENPGQSRAAGRALYVYDKTYMGGTLFAVLPCGRALLYPRIRWENRETKDRSTGKTVEKLQLTYRRGRGRAVLWVGVLVENLVQAFAGSLLRHALWRLDKEEPGLVVGHTHDEIVCMCSSGEAARVKRALESVMGVAPEWADGLPLAAESVVSEYYTKTAE